MTLSKQLALPLIKNATDRVLFANLVGGSLALTISECAKQSKQPIILVVSDTPTAIKLKRELYFFCEREIDIIDFPDWETLPYDHFSPHQDIISTRIETLHQLASLKTGILIVPITTLLLKIAPPSFLHQHTLILKIKQIIELQALRSGLEEAGYYAVEQVQEHGEFCARGSLLDIFPMGSKVPYRIDFFDDEIDSIRPFDSTTQRSLPAINEIKILPAHEFATDKTAMSNFKRQFANKFTSPLSTSKDSIFSEISQFNLPAGIEYYLPLFFDKTATLFDYLPKKSSLAIVGDINQATIDFWKSLEARYDDRCVDLLRPLLPPNELYLRHEECFSSLAQWPRYYLQSRPLRTPKKGRINFNIESLHDIQIEHKKKLPLENIKNFISNFPGNILFSVDSPGRRESLIELLTPLNLSLHVFNNISAAFKSEKKIGITISRIEHSFILHDLNFAFITETELLGTKISQRKNSFENYDENFSCDNILRNLEELKIGQPVVHIDHGIGKYLGLQTIETAGIKTEFMELEYLRGDKLFVPVSALNLISRYSGVDVDTAPISKLGTETWQKAKKRAAEKVRDVAAELLTFMHNGQPQSVISTL